MPTMYKKLLQLPLFQGLNKTDITDIIEKVTLHFQTIPANTLFVEQGSACVQLIFILEGSLIKKTENAKNNFSLEQEIGSPSLLEPQSLFGLNPTFQSSYTTATECSIMTIDKSFVLSELMNYPIFELNYLNILSSKYHNIYNTLWEQKQSNDLLSRFKYFIKTHTDTINGPITLYATMEDLAFLLNDTRLNVSKMLNSLSDQNIIFLRRKVIHIPVFNLL